MADNTDNYEKIHVMLYGGKPLFGGKEKPLVADEIYCCRKDECQFYAVKKCVCCRQAFGNATCPYGQVRRTKGYTSRAKKYREFRSRYREDPLYDAVDVPRDVFLRVVGEWVYVHPGSIDIAYNGNGFDKEKLGSFGECFTGVNGKIRIRDPFGGAYGEWIPKDELDVDAIHKICSFVPRAFMGGIIESYQSKNVPAFIDDLRNYWPERYREFEQVHPEMCSLEVDYIGRRVKALTIKDGAVITARNGNKFVFDGSKLVCDNYHESLGSVWGVEIRKARLEIPLGEDDVIEVKDNSWIVPGKTKFVS